MSEGRGNCKKMRSLEDEKDRRTESRYRKSEVVFRKD